MATGMKINNIVIPSPMDERGIYQFAPPAIVARNGRGAAIMAPYSILTWNWEYLLAADYAYWVTTILNSAASATFTANTLLINDIQSLATITECTVLRPTYERIEGGILRNVTLVIDRIRQA